MQHLRSAGPPVRRARAATLGPGLAWEEPGRDRGLVAV